MWTDLLPTLIGATLIDDDAPDEPTTITGYELTDEHIDIIGRDFTVGGARQYFGIRASSHPRELVWHGYGFSGVIRYPDFVETHPEILPDESDATALARVTARELAAATAAYHMEIGLPSGLQVKVGMTDEEFGLIAADQLWIGFYNKSGAIPYAYEFEGLADKDDEERREMGLPPRSAYHERRQQIMSRLLQADNSKPFVVTERVGLAILERQRRDPSVFRAKAKIIATSYVTHFAIGTRKQGIMMSGQYAEPIKMLAGHTLDFGLRLSRAIAERAEPKALPKRKKKPKELS